MGLAYILDDAVQIVVDGVIEKAAAFGAVGVKGYALRRLRQKSPWKYKAFRPHFFYALPRFLAAQARLCRRVRFAAQSGQ